MMFGADMRLFKSKASCLESSDSTNSSPKAQWDDPRKEVQTPENRNVVMMLMSLRLETGP